MQLWAGARRRGNVLGLRRAGARACRPSDLYGVKAYSVARRTREIGIRMALGAQRQTVQRMILREGSAMLAPVLSSACCSPWRPAKSLAAMLYQVSPFDPIAFTVAPLVLALAGLLATWLPARRATRISPMDALRTE